MERVRRSAMESLSPVPQIRLLLAVKENHRLKQKFSLAMSGLIVSVLRLTSVFRGVRLEFSTDVVEKIGLPENPWLNDNSSITEKSGFIGWELSAVSFSGYTLWVSGGISSIREKSTSIPERLPGCSKSIGPLFSDPMFSSSSLIVRLNMPCISAKHTVKNYCTGLNKNIHNSAILVDFGNKNITFLLSETRSSHCHLAKN